LAAVGLIALIESDPGYVLISYGLTTVEMSLWVGLVILLLFNLLCYGIFRLWRKLLAGRGSLANWTQDRKTSKGRRLTSKGLFSYMEGNWAHARRVLAQAAPHSETPALNYLMAARASHSLRDSDKVDHYLSAAALADTRASKVVGLTRAELLLEVGQLQAAADVLDALSAEGGKDVQLLNLQLQAYRGLSQWGKLAPLLGELKKNKILAGVELQSLEREVYSGMFAAASASSTQAESDKVWGACPGALRKDPAILANYAQSLLRSGEHPLADKLLERALKKQWDSRLVNLYGLVESGEPARRQKVAERWLKQHSEDAVLLRCLGRLALRNKLWGQGRDYFESSFRLQPNSETCAELARLLFNLGEREKSAQCYREGLLLRENNLPELPQPSISPNR
ncbi:MAG: hypothetical protein O7F73_19115, partial [Gammaproteobacteria bacterium]|nr:hypothetical protein [Gammaproteobacteria bacterium]